MFCILLRVLCDSVVKTMLEEKAMCNFCTYE